MITNPLLERDFCFHSIGCDVFRIESILKLGILTQNSLLKTGMPKNSVDGHNGVNKVSVFMSPLFCGLDLLDEQYTNGIVFVCETDYSTRGVESGIRSEAHVKHDILRNQIKGIMLPDLFWHTPIGKYNKFVCGENMLPELCNSFTKWMKEECGYMASDYKELLLKIKREKEKNTLSSEKYNLLKELGSLIFDDVQRAVDKKLGKHNATFADLVKYYIKDTNLILYNKDELEKDQTYLKRLEMKKDELKNDPIYLKKQIQTATRKLESTPFARVGEKNWTGDLECTSWLELFKKLSVKTSSE